MGTSSPVLIKTRLRQRQPPDRTATTGVEKARVQQREDNRPVPLRHWGVNLRGPPSAPRGTGTPLIGFSSTNSPVAQVKKAENVTQMLRGVLGRVVCRNPHAADDGLRKQQARRSTIHVKNLQT